MHESYVKLERGKQFPLFMPILIFVISCLLLIAVYFNYHFSIVTVDSIRNWHQSFKLTHSGFLIVAGGLIATYTFFLYVSLKESLKDYRRLFDQYALSKALLSCFSLGIYRCDGEVSDNMYFYKKLDLLFENDDLLDIKSAIEAFEKNAVSFSHKVTTKEGEMVEVKSLNLSSVLRAVILQKEPAILSEYQAQIETYKESASLCRDWQMLLNSYPLPLWIENQDGKMKWANEAYQALGTSEDEDRDDDMTKFVSSLKELGNRHKIVNINLAGQQKKYSFQGRVFKQCHLFDCDQGQEDYYLGIVQDLTDLNECKADLKRHLAGQQQILESLNTAIAIYGPDQRLDFYNFAYQDLWQLPADFIKSRPSYSEVFEDIRLRKKLPGHRNFTDFKNQRLTLFKTLTETYEDMFYLPDGRVLHNRIVPHPYGGIIFIQEDVTKNLSMEGKYQTLQAVQKETLNNMAEGVAVFGADGRLKLFNPAFNTIFKIQVEDFDDAIHIRELSQKISEAVFDKKPTKMAELQQVLHNLALEREPQSGVLKLMRGRTVQYSVVPLPDGANLNTFLDITDSVKLEENLKARNVALKKMDQFKSEFISRASFNLKTPLNSILGFSEILEGEYLGGLTPDQKDYIHLIRDEGQKILNLIENIIDLTSLEAQKTIIHREETDMKALFAEIESYIHHPQSLKKIRVKSQIDHNLQRFPLDHERFKQAFFSLYFQLSENFEELLDISFKGELRKDGAMVVKISAFYKDAIQFDDIISEDVPEDGEIAPHDHFSLAKSLVEFQKGRFESKFSEKTIEVQLTFKNSS